MGYNPNIPHLISIYLIYNPFTNHLLTSWDIQALVRISMAKDIHPQDRTRLSDIFDPDSRSRRLGAGRPGLQGVELDQLTGPWENSMFNCYG